MKSKYLVKSAFQSLVANKMRALLTILGIVIGIASIIIIVSIGNGARALIVNEINALGTETISIRPGQETRRFGAPPNNLDNSLTKKDLDRLSMSSNVPFVKEIMPFVIIPGRASYNKKTYTSSNFGADADFFVRSYDLEMLEGGWFGKDEIDQKAKVAVIGSKVAEELFDGESPIGRKIGIGNKKFKVVGVYKERGTIAFFNVDDLVLVPYTTAQSYVLGINYFNQIIIKTKGAEYVDKTAVDIKNTLRDSHKLEFDEENDFTVGTQKSLLDQVETIVGILTSFLTAVVAISLVVGGIGIMNIMLVTVTERTKEIGLRKALGAKYNDILRQFLFEAVVLTSIGGVCGIVLGTLIGFGVIKVLSILVSSKWVFVFPWGAALIGLIVSAGVGIVFGLYPAKKAAKMSPIEALRYE